MMNFEQQLQNALVCTYLESIDGCDKKCQNCHRAFEDAEIMAAYYTAIEALEKPKDTKKEHGLTLHLYLGHGDSACLTLAVCPSCREVMSKKYSYCPSCGQALDWSEEEE